VEAALEKISRASHRWGRILFYIGECLGASGRRKRRLRRWPSGGKVLADLPWQWEAEFMYPVAPSISRWRKSTRSAQGSDCVEIADWGPTIWVRDSKDPYGPRLTFLVGDWGTFVTHVRSGTIR
jgi:hypothetical protein